MISRKPTHPGVVLLEDVIKPLGLTITDAARMLDRLDASISPQDMDLPGYRLHPLKGDKQDMWSVTVNGNWRLTFYFEGQDAHLVDYQDYH